MAPQLAYGSQWRAYYPRRHLLERACKPFEQLFFHLHEVVTVLFSPIKQRVIYECCHADDSLGAVWASEFVREEALVCGCLLPPKLGFVNKVVHLS